MKTENIDYEYIFSKMSDMSGLPVRIYTGRHLDAMFSIAPLIADPAEKYRDTLLRRKEHVSYFVAENMDYYGVLKTGNKTMIIGPSRTVPYTPQEISDMAFDLGVTGKDFDAFSRSMKTLLPMPLGTILQMMCSVNYSLNGEKLNLSDFEYEGPKNMEYYTFESEMGASDYYKNYNTEHRATEIVRSGDMNALEEWARSVPTVRPSLRIANQLRQEKNSFIISVALISRTAIDEGVDVEEAIKLSDTYIRRCENTRDLNDIRSLQYEMISTFTSRVGMMKRNTGSSRLVHDVYSYIINHLSDSIKTDDIADALFLSRSYLSTAFKKQAGITLNAYIHKIKTEKAKELLPDPTKSIGLISDYLGYSSSSHFNKVFRENTGMTPLQYRRSV